MRKIEQIAADGNMLYVLSDDKKVFSKHIGNAEWDAIPDLPQDDQDLSRLVESGTKAWAHVSNATEFVEDLRGNDSPMHFASALGIGQNPEPYAPHEVNAAYDNQEIKKFIIDGWDGLIQLLSCAACGGKPDIHYKGNDLSKKGKFVTIKCMACRIQRTDGSIDSMKKAENYAVENWNKKYIK